MRLVLTAMEYHDHIMCVLVLAATEYHDHIMCVFVVEGDARLVILKLAMERSAVMVPRAI